MLGKFFSSIIGLFSIQTNKKGSYIVVADQYLKHSPKCRELFKPHIEDLINRILTYSNAQKTNGVDFSSTDKIDLLKETVQKSVVLIAPEDLLNFPFYQGRKNPKASIIALDFVSDNSLL